jgi:thiamine-phosphate pyrophosphorylase
VPLKWHEAAAALYAIADASFGDPVALADKLFAGGVRLLQVRNKKGSSRELLQQVEQILAMAPARAYVLVNDRVDVALLVGAAGVHLGQTDLNPALARQILGPDRLIGLSTHNLEQALEADKLPVDYIGVGPVFWTSSKENPDPVLGLEKLAEICEAVRKPVVAIGGITIDQAEQVRVAGARSVAVIRDLLASDDIAERARQWCETLRAFPV